MKENQLIKILIFIGFLSVLVIFISSYISKKNMESIMPKLFPSIVCLQDKNKTYFIGEPLTIEKCQYIQSISDFSKEDFCLYYKGNKADACNRLRQALDQKTKICLQMIMEKEVNKTDDGKGVELDCKILRS